MSEEFEDEEIQDTVELSLKDTETLVDESKELLKNLYNIDEPRAKRIITQDDLRNDISSFVSSQLQNLENQNTLKGLLEAEIAKKVLAHDLSTDEIFRAYSMISGENIDSLFKLFAPTQASPNSVLTPATRTEERESVELTSSQRQSLEKLLRVVEHSPNLQNKNESVE